MSVSRRDALKLAGLGGLGAAGLSIPLGQGVSAKSASQLAARLMPKPYVAAFAVPLPRVTSKADGDGVQYYDIREAAGAASLLPGSMLTPVWGYDGRVPGAPIVAERGVRIEATIRNRLPSKHPQFGYDFTTSVHLHGSDSLPQYDGYANDVTKPGWAKTYHWPNDQPARTLWYHDHAAHHTAQNAYGGLAAQYHLHDDEERDLLPQGAFDVPLTITDAMFAANGSLGYDDRLHSGLYGDVVLVNGRPWPVMKVQRRIYRFRILNASISRSYRPTLLPQGEVHVVATDGGLMPRSQLVTQWRHGVAERYEVLIDFSQYKEGQRVELRNLSNPNNRDFDHTNKIMAFDVTDAEVDRTGPAWKDVPEVLATSDVMALTAADSKRTRQMRLKKDDVTNLWSINDRSWADVVDSGFTELFASTQLNDVEIWEIDNRSGGWHHPLHIHMIDFQILSRNGKPPFSYERGPKDVVYVGEQEKVRVIARFGPSKGRYMIHCHNLPHEDHDMMAQFSVGWTPGQWDPHDPITAAPPWEDGGS